MRLTNEICISFLRGSGWLYNHDKEITISERNKAIDDFAKLVEIWCWKHEQYNQDDLNKLMNIAEQLKAGGENERSI